MKISRVLKWYLLIISLYLLGDGFVHVLNIKLLSPDPLWPSNIVIFSKYMSQLYGMFTILAALFGIEVSRNLEKYQNFLYITSVWGVIYGLLLIYYNFYIIFEACLLYVFVFLVFLWSKRK